MDGKRYERFIVRSPGMEALIFVKREPTGSAHAPLF